MWVFEVQAVRPERLDSSPSGYECRTLLFRWKSGSGSSACWPRASPPSDQVKADGAKMPPWHCPCGWGSRPEQSVPLLLSLAGTLCAVR